MSDKPDVTDTSNDLQGAREHIKQLTAEIKAERAKKTAAQDALQAAQDDAKQWRDRWHQSAVIEPFEASLEHASAVPTKYLRAELLDIGVLKMEADADGIERPAWYTKDGKPADMTDGIHRFLLKLDHPNTDRMIRSSGVTGGGAGSSGPVTWQTKPETKPPAAPSPGFGLR